ncbi:unnamed protein product [Closterium sp. NIES-54]
MRLCSVSGDIELLSAILQQTSCPPMPFPVSSLASPLTHLAGSSTTPPPVVFCPLRTSRLMSRCLTTGPAPSGVSQVDPAEPVEAAVNSGAARGVEPTGAGTGGAEPGVSVFEGAEPGGAEPERVEPGGAEPGGAGSGGAEPERAASGGPPSVPSRREPLSPQQLRKWYARRCRGATGAGASRGAGGAAGAGVVGGTGAVGGPAEAGAAGGTGAGGAAGVVAGYSGVEGTGAVSAISGGAARPRPYYVSDLYDIVAVGYSGVAHMGQPLHSLRPRPPPVPGTHSITLRPSTASRRVSLPSPPASSLPDGSDPESESLRAASPAVTRFLATAVSDPLFESTAAFALVAELVDFAAACRLDHATSLVAESASASVCPPSVGGECALGTDVLEDRQEEFECFAAAVPHLVSMLLAPEGDPDAPDILTPRSYAEAIEGPYSSQWQAAMDAEMASWKSTGTYVDEVPPPGVNIVSDMWIFRVKRPPGSPPAFKACYVARGFNDLVFATADTEALAHMKSELQKRHTCTDLACPSALRLHVLLATVHSSAYRSLALSSTFGRVHRAEWPYPELVGCLIHRNLHWDAAKRVLRYLCSMSGMGLVLGGRAQVVLTGHADASWVDDLATQRSSQGYTFSLSSDSVSWRSTRSSSVLSSSCEAEIYAGAMAAQELC